MKRIIAYLLCVLLVVGLTACGKTQGNGTDGTVTASQSPVPMTEEEEQLAELMKEDTVTVTDADYAARVSEILANTAEQTGKVFELEGVLGADGESKTVYRTLVKDGQKTMLALPLRYMDKNIAAGAWIHVIGVVAADDSGNSVLDVVAVESLANAGNAELS